MKQKLYAVTYLEDFGDDENHGCVGLFTDLIKAKKALENELQSIIDNADKTYFPTKSLDYDIKPDGKNGCVYSDQDKGGWLTGQVAHVKIELKSVN